MKIDALPLSTNLPAAREETNDRSADQAWRHALERAHLEAQPRPRTLIAETGAPVREGSLASDPVPAARKPAIADVREFGSMLGQAIERGAAQGGMGHGVAKATAASLVSSAKASSIDDVNPAQRAATCTADISGAGTARDPLVTCADARTDGATDASRTQALSFLLAEHTGYGPTAMAVNVQGRQVRVTLRDAQIDMQYDVQIDVQSDAQIDGLHDQRFGARLEAQHEAKIVPMSDTKSGIRPGTVRVDSLLRQLRAQLAALGLELSELIVNGHPVALGQGVASGIESKAIQGGQHGS